MGDIVNAVLVRSDLLILGGFGIAMILLFCLLREHRTDREGEALQDPLPPATKATHAKAAKTKSPKTEMPSAPGHRTL